MFRMRNLKATSNIRIAKIKGKPYDLGEQRGQQLADMIRAKRDRWIKCGGYFDASEQQKQRLNDISLKYEEAINKRFPEIVDELKGIAAGSKIPYEEIRLMVLGNLPSKMPIDPQLMKPRTEVNGINIEECSSFVASGPATADGFPIMAKNGDYSPAPSPIHLFQEDACMIYAEPADGHRYVAVGAYPEWPGNSEGMNEEGFALCGSGVTPYYETEKAYENNKPVGVPIHLLQSVMYSKCASIDDSLDYLKLAPRGYGGRNMSLADSKGCILKAEVAYEHLNLIWPYANARYFANWVLAGSSHFASKEMNWMSATEAEYPSTYRRFDRLMELLVSNSGNIDFDFAKRAMRDHKHGPGGWSLCRHGPVYTLESFIIQPSDRRIWCCVGYPCENEYEPFVIKQK